MKNQYQQKIKNKIRHKSLLKAITSLTVERETSCCVHRTYVRNVADYFLSLDSDEPAYKETNKIKKYFFSAWESLHDSAVGHKRASDLTVCYLSGPQPQNDFDELIQLGVLPQNIWAFENNNSTFLEAINTYNANHYPQPKIVKMSIEQFFKQSPKKFDIVYIDACGSIPSTQHALRSVSTLFQYQRLNSPGVLITNFSKPNFEKLKVLKSYEEILALYFSIKQYPQLTIIEPPELFEITKIKEIMAEVQIKPDYYYGEFITNILTDIPSIIIPLQRFSYIAQYSNIFNPQMIKLNKTTLEEINLINNNSLCKFLLTLDYLKTLLDYQEKNTILQSFCNELVGLDGQWVTLINGIKIYIGLRCGNIEPIKSIKDTELYFNNPKNLYQFLDKPTILLFYDLIMNQLAYPMHVNLERSKRYQYCAKETDMFMDITILDECRYLYEWLPTIHQIQKAMNNLSWQYTFRFAIDGLVKQRLNYNNDSFSKVL